MSLRDWGENQSWRMRFAIVILAAGAVLFPARAFADGAGTCTAGTTVRLSAPEASQGSLLLIALKSTKSLAEVQGDWGGRSVPMWRAGSDDARRKGLLGIDLEKHIASVRRDDHVDSAVAEAQAFHELHAPLLDLGWQVDLEKEPGEYGLKITGETASGEKVSCSVKVAVRQGRFATERLQVGTEFVEPNPEQVKRANEERQKLRDIFDRVTPERLWDGPFRVPLDGVTTGSNFGKRRILNGNAGSPHGGADFPAVTGTPVHAAQRGNVALAEELFFSGNTVVLDHGLGIYTFYGHLSEIDVKAGDALEAGAVLGKVGATGRVTGPHLHWGLTVERARVNPLLLVKLLGNSPEVPARKRSLKRRTR